MPYSRTAMCCYCGTSTSLPKKTVPGRIGCASCGAPLRRVGVARPEPLTGTPRAAPAMAVPVRSKPPHPRKQKRRAPLLGRMWERLEDVVEDVVDEIFD